MIRQRSGINIQFGQSYDPEKTRRLVDELASLNRAFNAVVAEINAISSGDSQSLGHSLASTTGLGSQHTVEGLQSDMVLKATGPNDAAFGFLSLDDLGDVDVDGAAEGDALRKIGSSWVASPIPDFTALGDPDEDAAMVWNDASGMLELATLGTTLALSGGVLSVVASGVDHGSLSGLTDDDHGAVYPSFGQVETISAEWTFDAGTYFNDDIVHSMAAVRQLWQETDADTDEMIWELFIDGGVFGIGTRDDADSAGVLFLQAMRDGTDVLEWSLLVRDLLHTDDEPVRITIDDDADAEAGRWQESHETGQWMHGIRSDDGFGGENWVQVLGLEEQIEQINFQGGLLTFNGDEVLAVQSTSSTAPSAGAADALPATPAGYAKVVIDGESREIAYY